MKSLSKLLLLAGVILVSGLTMSCEKEEDLQTDPKSVETDPNVKIEVVDIESGDWSYIGEGTYQAAVESSNIGTKDGQIKVYYKLPKEELGTEGIWKELPYEGYDFTLMNSQILISRTNECDPSCTFKIEVYQTTAKDNIEVKQTSLPLDMDPVEYTF